MSNKRVITGKAKNSIFNFSCKIDEKFIFFAESSLACHCVSSIIKIDRHQFTGPYSPHGSSHNLLFNKRLRLSVWEKVLLKTTFTSFDRKTFKAVSLTTKSLLSLLVPSKVVWLREKFLLLKAPFRLNSLTVKFFWIS